MNKSQLSKLINSLLLSTNFIVILFDILITMIDKLARLNEDPTFVKISSKSIN